MTPPQREPAFPDHVTPTPEPTPVRGDVDTACGAPGPQPGTAPPSALLSAVAVSFTRALSLLLTLAFGVLSAAYFGASVAKDCYIVAQAPASLLGTTLVSGVYGMVLVALAEIGSSQGATGQLVFLRRILLQIAAILIPLSLVATLFPRPVIAVIAPGFGPDQLDLSSRLLPYTLFTMVGTVGLAVLRALYNTRHQFALPGFVGLLVIATSIVTLVMLVERAGIFALVLGQLIGTLLTLIVLGAAAFLLLKDPPGFVPQPLATAPGRGRGLWRDFLPMSIGANFGQVNLVIDNAFASYLSAGNITQLGFATVIFSHAEFLTIFSLAEVAFPRFTAADRRGAAALEEELRLNLRYMILLAAPIAAGCLTFGVPLARLLFERGEFGGDSTTAVARILACLGPEILFMGYFACFWRILYARRRLRALVWTSVGAMTLNAALNALLMRPLGILGIALSTTCATAVFTLIFGALMRREGLRIFGPGDRGFIVRVLLGAAAMGGVVLGWSALFEGAFSVASETARLLEVGGGLALAALAYAVALQLLGIRAVPDALRRLARLVTDWRRG
jgi:putative peptidoglycan lipid II flippase